MFRRAIKATRLGMASASTLCLLISMPAQAVCVNNGTGTVTSPNSNDDIVCTNTDANLDIIISADNVSVLVDDGATLTDTLFTFFATPNRSSITLNPGASVSGGPSTVRTILVANTDVIVGTGTTVNGDRFGIASSSNDVATVVARGTVQGSDGSISFGGGNDELTLETGVNLVGDVFGNGGMDQVWLNGVGSFSDSFNDFEVVHADGVNWQLGQIVDGATINANSGTLTLAGVANGALNAAGGQVLVSGSINDSTVNVTGGTLTVANELRNTNVTIASGQNLISTGSFGFQGNGSVDIGAGGTVTFDISSGNGGAANGIAFTGTGGIVKNGAGGLVMSGNNNSRTFTGGVTVNEGVFTLVGVGIGDNDVILNNQSVMSFSANGGIADFDGDISGTRRVVKSGNYQAILNGTNIYSGGTTITDGTNMVTSSGHVGTGAVNVTGNGRFRYNLSGVETLTETIEGAGVVQTIGVGNGIWNGDASNFSGTLPVSSNSLQINGTNTIGTAVVDVNTNLRLQDTALSNDIGGTGSVQSNGDSMLMGANTYGGGTNVITGSLLGDYDSFGSGAISLGDAILELNSDQDGTLANNVSGSGMLRKSGTGIAGISGTLSHSGGIDVQAGHLYVTAADMGSNTVSVASAAVLGVDVANGDTDLATNAFANAGTLTKTSLGTLGFNNASRIGGSLDIEAGTVQLTAATSDVDDLFDTVSIDSGTTLNLDGANDLAFRQEVRGAGTLTKSGSGTATLSGTLDLDGDIQVLGGELRFASADIGGADITVTDSALTLATNSDETFSNDTSGNGLLRKAGTGTVEIGGTLAHTGGIEITDGRLNTTLVDLGASEVTVTTNGTLGVNIADGDTESISATLTNGGVVAKSGDGTLALDNAQALGGDLHVEAGDITLSGVANGVDDVVDEFNLAAGSNLMLTGAENFAVDSTVSGSGGLVKDGAATVTLSGTNTHTGGIAIEAGRLAVTEVGALGTGTLSLASDAELEVISDADQTLSANLDQGTLIVSGQGELTLTGTNNQTNRVDGTLRGDTAALGADVGIQGGGTLILDEGSNVVSDISISSNDGRFVKEGAGSVSLTNNGSLGLADINAGRLEVNGSMSGTFNVASGAGLGGVGTLTGDVTSAGVVAPGNSIGTLTVDGDFTLNTGGTLEIEFDEMGGDLLAVSGSASLSGGDLLLQPLDSSDGAGLTFLTADAGISGTFSTVSVQGGGQAAITYAANDSSITDDSGNGGGSGGGGGNTNNGDNTLTVLTARPTTANSQMSVGSQTASDFGAAVVTQLQTVAPEARDGVWLAGFGERHQRDTQGDALGYETRSNGAVFGYTNALNERWMLGFSVSNADGDADLDSGAGNTDVKSTLAALFATYHRDNWRIGAGLLAGTQQMDTDRAVVFDGDRTVLRADTDGDVLGAFAHAQLAFDLGDWQLTPQARLQITSTELDGYTETGSSPLRLRLEDLTADHGKAALTTRLSRSYNANDALFSPYFEVGVSRDFPLGDRDIDATFVDTDIAVRLRGDTAARTQWVFGAGMHSQINERWGWFVDLKHISAGGDERSRALLGVDLTL